MRAAFKNVLVASAIVAGVVLLWVLSQRLHDSRRALDLAATPAGHRGSWIIVALAAGLFYVGGRFSSPGSRWGIALAVSACFVALMALMFGTMASTAHEYVGHYCSYGARSSPQLATCQAHVRPRDVDRLHTRAARFARGEVSRCHRDAGPYCVTADGGVRPPAQSRSTYGSGFDSGFDSEFDIGFDGGP